MLKVKIDNYKYETISLLENINITFENNVLYCIVGNNGSGKTTFLNIIASLIPNVIDGKLSGSITYNNNPILYSDIDYVFQNSENSLFYNRVNEQLICNNQKELEYWIKEFHLQDYYKSYIRELSIGQKKIITCLMALLSNRKICILDEPTANLDNNNKKELLKLIQKVKKDKILIIVSHDKDLINNSDVVYSLDNKKLNLKEQKKIKDYRKKLKKNNCKKGVLLKLNGFKYQFENGTTYNCTKEIIIPTNSIIGLLGENGSGKTTFANYIIKNYKNFYKNGISKKKITCSIMFQTFYKQIFEFSVLKELLFGLNEKQKIFNQDDLLKEIGLYDKKNDDPRFISDGQKRILLISSLLMSKKDLIILDEPFDNIDETTKNKLKQLLKKYRDNGSTIIILDQTDSDFYDIVDCYIELK